MKKCPQCGREYNDETMSFCLDDGSELLFGPATKSQSGAIPTGFSGDEPQTAILSEPYAAAGGQSAGENPTRPLIHTTAAGAEPRDSLGHPSERHSFSARRTAKPRSKGGSRQRQLAVVGVAVLLLAGGYFGYRYFGPFDSGQIMSIAVLPFVNDSGNADVEYLSDGMTETLIRSLSNLPDMDVKPRSAVFRYKGRELDIPAIGKDLNVGAVLTGRVLQRGDQLDLSLELVEVQRNRVIWAEQYQRRQTDIVTLQSEIAKDVSAKLSPKLSGSEETKLAKSGTADPAAYQAYLRGRYFWNKRTGADMHKAIEQFQIAVDRDPNYALAYVGLADSYGLLPDYSAMAPADSLARSVSFAKRAIALDPQMAEPFATLGLNYDKNWQWADAESSYQRAIELNPNYATAYHWYSVLLFNLGRNEEASAAITRAHEIDPMSNIINQNFVQMLQMKNDHKAAAELALKMQEVDPGFPGGYFTLAWSYLKMGRTEEAISLFEKVVELSGEISDALSNLAVGYATAGRRAEAQKLIGQLEEMQKAGKADGSEVAAAYAALGEKDKAFEWLEKDISERTVNLPQFRWNPASEPLRDDPRFKEFVRRVGLPE